MFLDDTVIPLQPWYKLSVVSDGRSAGVIAAVAGGGVAPILLLSSGKTVYLLAVESCR